MTSEQKGNFGVLAVFTVALLVLLTGASVYFWQKYEKEKTTVEEPTDSPDVIETVEEEPADEPEAMTDEAVIVYTPSGLFTDEEKTEIQTKMINPFLDWNLEIDQDTVSMEIEKNDPEIAGYRYNITFINEGGVNGGFLYGISTPLEWWLPECLNGCDFSAEFAAKYPEIVALSE